MRGPATRGGGAFRPGLAARNRARARLAEERSRIADRRPEVRHRRFFRRPQRVQPCVDLRGVAIESPEGRGIAGGGSEPRGRHQLVQAHSQGLEAVLLLLHGADTLTGFTAGQLQALVPLMLNLHQLGISIAGIFWGLWLLPMGYLVFKSGFLPKILGVLLIIGGIGYLVDSFAAFLLPELGMNIALFTFWGEVLFPLWLVIKGVDVEQWQKRARESA